MSIGTRTRHAREYISITRKELANKMGVSVQMIYKWESGKSNPKNSTLRKIASALDLRLDYADNGEPFYFAYVLPDFVDTQQGMEAMEFNEQQLIDAMDGQSDYHNYSKTKNFFECEISKSLDRLNKDGKQEAVKRVEELTHIEKYTKED